MGWRQLEDRTTCVCAVHNRSAIQAAGGVHGQGSRRSIEQKIKAPVIGQAVQQVKGPIPPTRRRQLKYGAAVVGTAKIRCAIEIAGGVEDQTSNRVLSVR